MYHLYLTRFLSSCIALPESKGLVDVYRKNNNIDIVSLKMNLEIIITAYIDVDTDKYMNLYALRYMRQS